MSGRKSNEIPYEISDLDKSINKEISRNFSGGLSHLVQVGPQKMIVPSNYIDEANYYYNFPIRTDDVLVMGYPRSGTTLTQELAWLLLNQFDFREAARKSLIERVPLIESRSLATPEMTAAAVQEKDINKLKIYRSSPEILSNMTTRRVMKTHLHFNFLPENLLTCGCKIIYVARNPKDVIVSLYHLQRTSFGRNYCGSFEKFLEYFMSDLTLFAPYWTHLKQGWERRDSENVRFIFYEDFIKNRREHIKEMITFLGENVSTEAVNMLDYVSCFDNFKKYMSQGMDKEMNNKKNVDDDFIRKGKVGGWKEYFNDEMLAKIDQWIEENLASTGIPSRFLNGF